MDQLGPYLLGPNEVNQGIYTGDAKELAKAIPDESVDLIFTDPVYQNIDDYRWLAETAARVLKLNGWCVAFQSTDRLPQTFQEMHRYLEYRWLIIWHRNNEIKYRYSPVGKSTFIPAVVYSRNGAERYGWGFDLLSMPVFTDASKHKWSKPLDFVGYYLNVFAPEFGLIFDPFVGSGTVPAVCKMRGCRWLAFEIEPETAEQARQRVRETQPPLFTLESEQLELM